MKEWWRVLRPGGYVLVAFHSGDTLLHLDTWWDQPVDLDFRFWPVDTATAALQQAQFSIEATVRRVPYPDVEQEK